MSLGRWEGLKLPSSSCEPWDLRPHPSSLGSRSPLELLAGGAHALIMV